MQYIERWNCPCEKLPLVMRGAFAFAGFAIAIAIALLGVGAISMRTVNSEDGSHLYSFSA